MKSWCFYFSQLWDLSLTVSHTYAWVRITHPIFCMENIMKRTEKRGERAFILSGFGYLPQLPCDPLFTVVEILTNVPALFTFYYWSTLHPYCLWESPPHEIPLVPKSILIPLPAVSILDPTLTRGELQLLSFLNLKGLPASLHKCSAVPCPEITTP